MTRPRKSTPEQERLLYQEDADSDELCLAIHVVVSDQLDEHEARIRTLMDHPVDIVRGEAASRLIGMWGCEDLFDRGYRMLVNDPAIFVRMQLASAFGLWLDHIKRKDIDHPRRAEVLGKLVAALEVEQDLSNQRCLYRELCEVIKGGLVELPYDFKPETDIDWDMLAPFKTDKA